MENTAVQACLTFLNELMSATKASSFLNISAEIATVSPPYLRIIAPHQPSSFTEVRDAILSGQLATVFAIISSIREICIIPLRYFVGYTRPERAAALQCLAAVDDFMVKNEAVRSVYDAGADAPWINPVKAFSGAMACRTTLEQFLKTRDMFSLYYASEMYFPVGEAPLSVRSLPNPTSLSDVSEKLYDCQFRRGVDYVGATGAYASAEEFRDHVYRVFDTVIALYEASDPGTVAFANDAKAAFQKLFDQQMKMRAQGRTLASTEASAAPAPSPPHGVPAPAVPKKSTKISLKKSTTAPPSTAPPPPEPVIHKPHMPEFVKNRCLRLVNDLKTATRVAPNGTTYTPAQYFIDRVPDSVEGYYDIIKRPMWLNEIERKLLADEYASHEELQADIDLIIENCNTYNSDPVLGAEIRDIARVFQEVFRKLYKSAEMSIRQHEAKKAASVAQEIIAEPPKAITFPAPAPYVQPPAYAPAAVLSVPQPPAAGGGESGGGGGFKLRLFRNKTEGGGDNNEHLPPIRAPPDMAAHITFPTPTLIQVEKAKKAKSMHSADVDLTGSNIKKATFKTKATTSQGANISAVHDPSAGAIVPVVDQFEGYAFANSPEFKRMLSPNTLEDCRLAPIGWPEVYDWESAEQIETTSARNVRLGLANLMHNTLTRLKELEWAQSFNAKWIEVLPLVYQFYPEAQKQRVALQDVYEKFRNQLPRKQGAVVKGKDALPPRPAALRATSHVYMTPQELINDVRDVFDAAIKIHDPATWRGDPLDAEGCYLRARHLRKFFDYVVVEMFADTIKSMAPAREKQRSELHEFVVKQEMTEDTHQILSKLLRKLTSKKRMLVGIEYFVAPPGSIWKDLPKDYYEKITRPMDLLTLEQNLGERVEHSLYRHHGEFYDDLQRIFNNALTYNAGVTTPESMAIVDAAKRCLGEVEVLWYEVALNLWASFERSEINARVGSLISQKEKREQEAAQKRVREMYAQQSLEEAKMTSAHAHAVFLADIDAGRYLSTDLAPQGIRALAAAETEGPQQQALMLETEVMRIEAEMHELSLVAPASAQLYASAIADVMSLFQTPAKDIPSPVKQTALVDVSAADSTASISNTHKSGAKRTRDHWFELSSQKQRIIEPEEVFISDKQPAPAPVASSHRSNSSTAWVAAAVDAKHSGMHGLSIALPKCKRPRYSAMRWD